LPHARYRWTWFDPANGNWGHSIALAADAKGTLAAPVFPGGKAQADKDWAAKVVATR